MAERNALLAALRPLLATLYSLDAQDPESALAILNERHPLSDLGELAAFVQMGIDEGWLCHRQAGGVRFSRVGKADDPMTQGFSVDAVAMSGAGPGHTHPNGEFDLCFAVDGEPLFDGNAPGWTVYPPGSWHAPTVSGGNMNILYFLPGGAMRFEDNPLAEAQP